jgi:hypothetical protein
MGDSNVLTSAQTAHFRTFGFLTLRGVFNAAEMTDITREANQVWQEDTKSQGHPYQIVVPFVEHRPRLAELVDDDRIYLAIEDLLGSDFVWGGSEGHKGSFTDEGLLQWHTDRPENEGVEYLRVKMMMYLEPMKKETGALRVIPCSQDGRLREKLWALHEGQDSHAQTDISLTAFGVTGPDLPCHALEVEPGDVVLFDDRLYHGIYGKQEGRSFITTKYVKFAIEPSSEEDFEVLRGNDSGFGLIAEAFRNSQRPRIRGMVEKLRGWEEKLQG